MLTAAQFTELTVARGMRDKIKPVDRAVAAYATAAGTKPRDYGEMARLLASLRTVGNEYLRERPNSDRKAGVELMLRLVPIEQEVVLQLQRAQGSADTAERARSLQRAQEHYLAGVQRNPALSKYLTKVLEMVNEDWSDFQQALGFGKDTTAYGETVVRDDILRLQDLANRASTPGLVRAVLSQLLAARNVQQISPAVGMPGAKYNLTRDPGGPKYTVNHRPMYEGGARYRLGALVHELTHVCVAECFDNSVLMFAMPRNATDDEWMAVSRSRRGAMQALLQQISTNAEINANWKLKSELTSRCNYALESKVGVYLGNFKQQLLDTEGPEFAPRINGLITRGMGSELIEYDSVVNQMLIWCWMNFISEANPVREAIEALAAAELARRARAVKPRGLAVRPKPKGAPPPLPTGPKPLVLPKPVKLARV